ncbi:MAG: exodeoxyribonuclease V subunit alpha [Alloalcanivorax venustensis]|uniref:exodeoxyribonuclease V subunit alpha n=1 Tax=Alloalcanivorax venustensis TaxID=172371 RepID=UPI0030010BAB
MQTDLFATLDWQDALAQLRDHGLLRDLDVAVARFLQQQCPQAGNEVLLLAAFTSNQQASGHLCLDLNNRELATQLWGGNPPPALTALLPGGVDDWLRHLQQSVLVSEDGGTPLGGTPLVLDGGRLYLRRNWSRERAVAEAIEARLASGAPMPVAELRDALARLFPGGDEAHTDWQQVACALAVRGGIGIITGGPGTGKTTTVVRLLGVLQSLAMADGQRLRMRLAAPTGKAAARLTESIGEQLQKLPVDAAVRDAIPTEVTTLHRLLGTRPDSRHFRHHRDNPLHADLVVVDEASMIDMDMMASLLDALDPHTRLILLGDKDQLASVEAGAVMGDLCRDADQGLYTPDTVAYLREACGADVSPWAGVGSALAQQTAMLRTNWRFKDTPGIGELALAVNGGDPAAVARVFQQQRPGLRGLSLGGLSVGKETDALTDLLLDGDGQRPGLRALFDDVGTPPGDGQADAWAAQRLRQLTGQQLLSGLRSGPFGVDVLNRSITERLRREGLAGDHDWYPGRPVMMTRNDYQLGLMNGDVGLTLPHPDGLRVAFQLPDGRIKWVLPSRLDSADTVYAMTVHKAQGSEFGHTLLVLPDHPHPLLTRELIYTAVTRAKQAFTLIEYGPPTVLADAVRRRTWRASGLWQKLNR